MSVGSIYSRGGAIGDFSKIFLRGTKTGQIRFFSHWKLRKQTVFAEILKCRGAVASPTPSPSDNHAFIQNTILSVLEIIKKYAKPPHTKLWVCKGYYSIFNKFSFRPILQRNLFVLHRSFVSIAEVAESLFQTPTPLLFQNFCIQIWVRIFLILTTRLLFRLRFLSIQSKFTNVSWEEMTTQTPATVEIEKWLLLRVRPKEKGKILLDSTPALQIQIHGHLWSIERLCAEMQREV